MKKSIIAIFCFCAVIQSEAQNPTFVEQMKINVQKIDSAKSAEDFQLLINNFQRISEVEKNHWLPQYYLGYCYTMLGIFKEKNKEKDLMFEKAMEYVDGISSMEHDTCEVLTLKSLVYQMQISVKPAQRGQKLGILSDQCLEKSLKLNSENPRIYLMKGESLYYTPAMFGGSKEKACEMFHTAQEKYKTFKPENEIAPNWGLYRTYELLAECTKN